jgi:hypothetical protein
MMQGNQNKLDKNQNGKIDPQDFKMLRGDRKEAGDIDKPSLKDKLNQYNKAKKSPLKEGTEMGKPSLKAGFESAMQKERDFVLNRAKKREDMASDIFKKDIYKKPLKSMSKQKGKY